MNTFDLDNVPHSKPIDYPVLPVVVPMIYHRHRRNKPFVSDVIALSLYSQFSRRSGTPRFNSNEQIRAAFGINPKSTILLTGIEEDAPLERWWGMGEIQRREVIRAMKLSGIGIVTTPNYSLFTNRPRWDDLHSMKRIAIIHEEFLRENMPAALHVNGRTEVDFCRWASYIQQRPEITHIAYEFTTGTGWADQRPVHASWLADLATYVGRPLHLIVRGGVDLLPFFASQFGRVTVIDTSAFMKSVKRQKAHPKSA